jgi:hypothetical protein
MALRLGNFGYNTKSKDMKIKMDSRPSEATKDVPLQMSPLLS